MSPEDSYSYDGYGVMLSDTSGAEEASNADTSLLYAGEQYDGSADMYYNRARYYDPSNGRFNRTDPYAGNSQDPQSLHKYLYCHANPINAIDPSGRMGLLLIGLLVTFAIVSIIFTMYHITPGFYGKYLCPSAYNARRDGPAKIREYKNEHLGEIVEANTYANADLNAIFDAYIEIYPKVTSRRCLNAVEELVTAFKSVFSDRPSIKGDITFLSAALETTGPEPINILILLPGTVKTYNQFDRKDWIKYNTVEMQNIIFFYPGSNPVRPVGNLYEAVVNDSWNTYVSMTKYEADSF